MRDILHVYLKRAIAAVAAAAVMAAAIIGAYGHANAHSPGHPAVHMLDHLQGHDHADTPDAPASPCTDHATCLDTLCHGGHAIVAIILIGSIAKPVLPLSRWGLALHSAFTLPFERPPKSSALV